MEKSRAIELLKLAVPIKALTQQEYADFVEAVNMGMDALEQPTSPNTIDRKAALEALRKCQTYLYDARDPELKIELSSAEAAINNLPTIQPVATDTNVGDNSEIPNSSDCISRQQAIDALDVGAEYLRRVLDEVDLVGAEREKYKWGLGLIEAQISDIKELPPAQPEPQWIPVSERLPEESEYCIITANDGVDHRTTFAKFQKKAKSWDLTGARSYWKVVAWMPLPEPYKPNK